MTIPRDTNTTLALHLKVPNNLPSSPNPSPQLSPNSLSLFTQIPAPTKLQTPLTPPPQSSQSHFSFSMQQPPIVFASLEIFAKICEHLAPLDIIALSRVCKQYRTHLCSKATAFSQAIWRRSRTNFLTYPTLPPPQGMDEERYIKITNFDERCEFCGTNGPKSTRLYWEFQTRCCDQCLLERTMIHEEVISTNKISMDILDTIPCVWIRGGVFPVPVHQYYWAEEVESTIRMCDRQSKNKMGFVKWLSHRVIQHKAFMSEVGQRYKEDQKKWSVGYDLRQKLQQQQQQQQQQMTSLGDSASRL